MDKMSTANDGPGGRVVNVSSIAGVKTIPLGPIYAATKNGIVGLSRALGVSTIAPGGWLGEVFLSFPLVMFLVYLFYCSSLSD